LVLERDAANKGEYISGMLVTAFGGSARADWAGLCSLAANLCVASPK
jgi:hypothetical protein